MLPRRDGALWIFLLSLSRGDNLLSYDIFHHALEVHARASLAVKGFFFIHFEFFFHCKVDTFEGKSKVALRPYQQEELLSRPIFRQTCRRVKGGNAGANQLTSMLFWFVCFPQMLSLKQKTQPTN